MTTYELNKTAESASDNHDLVWAFDLGKGSIGEAVRRGNEFLHKASLIIPAEFAETKTAAGRRRMWRTRQAHKAREQWLEKVWAAAGLKLPAKRKVEYVDYQTKTVTKIVKGKQKIKTIKFGGKWKLTQKADDWFEREFAEPGDSTCYTSCLLRIKLLRGDPDLKDWQVYKALHSAIQKRGYGNVPWAAREAKRKAKSEDAEKDKVSTQKRVEEFERKLELLSKDNPKLHYPCYYDAYEMGLWDGGSQFKDRTDCRANSTRNQIVPRHLVEKEISDLLDAAAKQYKKLEGQADYLLYGPARKPYASFNTNPKKAPFLKEGAETDWQGVLGQKIPRFDNRIIGKCVLIPRLNVCKIRTDENGELHPQQESIELHDSHRYLAKPRVNVSYRCSMHPSAGIQQGS